MSISIEKSRTLIRKMVVAAEKFKGYMTDSKCIRMDVVPEFFDACALALEALDDIEEISKALYILAENGKISWDVSMQTIDKAEKWYSKEHVTRKSIIKVQLEEIMNHFTDPVTYDELIKAIQEMKGDDT